MAYVALYRQWRPQDFDNLVGQSHISVTLRNAIISKKIAHAYLFSGPRGTGKTSTAKILAKSLNCIHGPTPEPCNVCLNCQSINTGTSMDVFEIDAASNRGIDEIRELRETVKFAPVDGRYKVYIIDEVHMLTTEAFNALLKTLEEPPAHVVFILATTEAHKIPATIHSRCQRYDFRRIDAEAIESRLAAVVQHEGLNVAPDAIKLIASHADGGLRDALSILDQCTTMENGIITAEKVRQLLGLIGHEWVWRVTEAIAERDFRAVLMALGELIALGKEVRQILLEVALYMRSIMLFKAAPDIDSIELYGDDRNVLAKHGGQFKHDELIDIIKILNEGANDAKWAPEPRITAEMTLLSICRRSVQTDMMNLLERIAILEAKVGEQSFPRMEPQIAKQVETVRPPTLVKQVAVQPVVSPKLVEKIEIKQEIAHEHHQTEPVVSSSLPSSDVKEIWDNVLKELVASGKRSVHACVSQGKLISLDDKQAIVQFAAAFPKERTEKEDYRIMIEKVLTQFCGKTVQLCCILGSAKVTPKSSVAPPKEKPVATVPSLEEEIHPALRQAIHMFGGKVTKKEE